jgi:hypothetical protein
MLKSALVCWTSPLGQIGSWAGTTRGGVIDEATGESQKIEAAEREMGRTCAEDRHAQQFCESAIGQALGPGLLRLRHCQPSSHCLKVNRTRCGASLIDSDCRKFSVAMGA